MHGSTVLHAAGFVLDQSPQLEDIDLDTVRAPARIDSNPPLLGPYRTYPGRHRPSNALGRTGRHRRNSALNRTESSIASSVPGAEVDIDGFAADPKLSSKHSFRYAQVA